MTNSPAAHADAFKALLGAAAPLLGKVVDTVKVNATGGLVRDNYAVVYAGGPEVLDDDRYTATQRADSTSEWEPTVRYVGIDANSARLMFAAGQTALIGKTLTISGRVNDRIRFLGADRVEEDRNVTPSLFYVDAEYAYTSRPA